MPSNLQTRDEGPLGDDSPVLVLTNAPDVAVAEAIGRAVVELRLAACVNILAPCLSIYRWQGDVETATEIPMLIKTTHRQYAALEGAIRARHPYELPEVICVPITTGLPAYLAWLVEETAVR